MTTPPSLRAQVAASLALLIVLLSPSSPCLAFVLPTNLQITHPRTPLCSTPTKEPPSTKEQQEQLPKLSLSSLDKLQVIKQALKRPRGASIGVQYSPTTTLSDGDLSIFSMQLRKSSKSSAIYTCDVESLSKIIKEQESSRSDFPGPVPVIYYDTEAEKLDSTVVESASAVVIEYGTDCYDLSSLQTGIIWKVNSIEQLQDLIDMDDSNNAGGVFLLSRDMLPSTVDDDDEMLKNALSQMPKPIVTIAELPTMLPQNYEVTLGKYYANTLGISSLLLTNACVGDEEDISYTTHVIEGINKKSSSSFSMTGLTGSTNGHFGVSSHSGEVKWRRRTDLN